MLILMMTRTKILALDGILFRSLFIDKIVTEEDDWNSKNNFITRQNSECFIEYLQLVFRRHDPISLWNISKQIMVREQN